MRHSFLDPATVLFGKTRRRVLGLLFGHPDESFYVRDIVRRSGAAHGAIARELTALLGAGLVWRDERGRRVYYKANKHAPIFPELERLVGKTLVVGDLLRDALEALGDRVELAGLFGRAVTGEVAPDRAIDLLVIGDVRPGEVAEALAAMKPRRAVSPKVHSMTEFRKKAADNPDFFTSFLSGPPLFVIGEPDDFRRLRTSRSSKRRA